KRQVYDRYGPEGPPGFAPGGGGGGFHFNFRPGAGGERMDARAAEEFFREIFGDHFGMGAEDLGDLFGVPGGRGRRRARTRRPTAEDTHLEMRVPFRTAAEGGTVPVRVGTAEVDLKIPAGIEDGKTLRMQGLGPGGGDIYVKVRVEPHPYFRREGNNLVLEVPVTIPEAVLGGKVEVPTLSGGRLEVKVPPGTSSGARLRVRGQGIAGGDLYLQFKIVAPAATDQRSRELLEEFAKLHPQNPRAQTMWGG
ncbi:MAG TPA: J domain-containing protein, partial [Gemmataceae bacterium]